MTTTHTRHFRWGIPDFDTDPWHADFAAMVNSIDSSIYAALIATGATDWTNSHVYGIGDIVISPDDGTLWVCETAHTSAVSPTAFTTDRLAHPSYWVSLMPDVAASSSADLASASEMRASAYAVMALNVSRRLTMRVSLALAQALSAAQAAYSMAQQGKNFSNRSREAQLSASSSRGASAAYAASAANSKRQAAASALTLTDDQIVLKSQVFG